MNDEIKEMNLSEMLFNRDERLIDYITNLQQENNNLKTSLDESQEVVIDLQQRIEKALHLITHSDITDYRVFDEELLNILEVKEGD